MYIRKSNGMAKMSFLDSDQQTNFFHLTTLHIHLQLTNFQFFKLHTIIYYQHV